MSIATTTSSDSSSYATVEHIHPSKCPLLTAGDLTPEVMHQFERACRDFFEQKEIKESDQVRKITAAFRDARIADWIQNERDTLVALTFTEFMVQVRDNYLEDDWERKLRRRLTASALSPPMSFWDWYQEILKVNFMLKGTKSFLDDEGLRHRIESGIDEDLDKLCTQEKVDAVKVLKDFVSAVRNCDMKRRAENKRARDAADASRAAESTSRKRQALSGPSRNVNATSTTSSNAPRSNTTYPQRKLRLLPLTDSQRAYLIANQGCFKCRLINLPSTHVSRSCPTGYPNADTFAQSFSHAAHVATTVDNPAYVAPAPAPAAAPIAATASFTNPAWSDEVAAIMPSNNSFTTPIAEEDSDEEASTPHRARHLLYSCTVNGPSQSLPVPIVSLIDNGAHLTLISPELVAHLGISTFTLKTPELVSVAMKSPSAPKTVSSLTSYVKLSVSSVDGQWHSSPIRTLIAPGLCAPVILGLPWLEKNHIVIDHAARTCIDKRCNYNLFKPVPRTPVPLKRKSPKAVRQDLADNRKRMLAELKYVCNERLVELTRMNKFEYVAAVNPIAAIRSRIEQLASTETLRTHDTNLKREFACLFQPLPHVNDLPTDVYAQINLKDASKKISTRTYQCPRKFREAFKVLIQQHLDAGRIQPSSSPHASPAFIIPKADPNALPRWVNDYRQLNSNTVTDSHPLPRIDDILNDCAKGCIWAKLDMTNSFFQTKMDPAHVALTAVSTPFGLFEWLVMPMGLRNAPAIHQRRVNAALRAHIGKICHVYLDDIVIWSSSLEEHHRNVRTILQALKDARLYMNPDKSQLYCTEIDFLGHHISARGIEADEKKVDRIIDWPRPKSATDVRAFLGLVRYIGAFLPDLATHSDVLNELTSKEAEKCFPSWTDRYQLAFDAIKSIVISRECLTTIDHSDSTKTIFVTTDASDRRSGAVLSFGETWETARPVAFDSMTFKGAELNYPVHEKELLAIIRAMRKWRSDLLGSTFLVFTDHKTLENFDSQRDLSRRQARWMEFMAQFDCRIVYVRGEDNTVADALSRLPVTVSDDSRTAGSAALSAFEIPDDDLISNCINSVLDSTGFSPFTSAHALSELPTEVAPEPASEPLPIAASFRIASDPSLLERIRKGYTEDDWSKHLASASRGMAGIKNVDGLWYLGSRLCIPRVGDLRETLFRLAHDTLGHFGFDKTYASLRDSYYWPKMRRDLEQSYVPGCRDCQRNKSPTHKPSGPLHPLPIPEQRGDSVAIDFVGPLPEDSGFNSIITMTDRLGSDIQIVPSRTDISASDFALLFFEHWFCENGLPLEIICDRDKLFISKFWKALHVLTGIDIKMSSAYHPQTDGSSERSNKTVNQALRYHVDRNQSGWVRALPRVRFDIMNTVNKSTGFSPFHLRMGRSPRVIPPLLPAPDHHPTKEEDLARSLIIQMERDLIEAKDNLLQAKITQAAQANKHRNPDHRFKVNDRVMLSTAHRRHEYKVKSDGRAAKFMPRYDGPYTITKIDIQHSTVTVNMPNRPKAFNTFHFSEVLPFHENDSTLFPTRQLAEPGPATIIDGEEEYLVDKIIDSRRRGRGHQYLVTYVGYGPEENRWLSGAEVAENHALDVWLAGKGSG